MICRDIKAAESLEKAVDFFLIDEWTSVAQLYSCVFEFARFYNGNAVCFLLTVPFFSYIPVLRNACSNV